MFEKLFFSIIKNLQRKRHSNYMRILLCVALHMNYCIYTHKFVLKKLAKNENAYHNWIFHSSNYCSQTLLQANYFVCRCKGTLNAIHTICRQYSIALCLKQCIIKINRKRFSPMDHNVTERFGMSWKRTIIIGTHLIFNAEHATVILITIYNLQKNISTRDRERVDIQNEFIGTFQ